MFFSIASNVLQESTNKYIVTIYMVIQIQPKNACCHVKFEITVCVLIETRILKNEIHKVILLNYCAFPVANADRASPLSDVGKQKNCLLEKYSSLNCLEKEAEQQYACYCVI